MREASGQRRPARNGGDADREKNPGARRDRGGKPARRRGGHAAAARPRPGRLCPVRLRLPRVQRHQSIHVGIKIAGRRAGRDGKSDPGKEKRQRGKTGRPPFDLLRIIFHPDPYEKSSTPIRTATRLITLIIGLIAGPAVSLYGSPTVSPVTAAWCAGLFFPP